MEVMSAIDVPTGFAQQSTINRECARGTLIGENVTASTIQHWSLEKVGLTRRPAGLIQSAPDPRHPRT